MDLAMAPRVGEFATGDGMADLAALLSRTKGPWRVGVLLLTGNPQGDPWDDWVCMVASRWHCDPEAGVVAFGADFGGLCRAELVLRVERLEKVDGCGRKDGGSWAHYACLRTPAGSAHEGEALRVLLAVTDLGQAAGGPDGLCAAGEGRPV